MQKTATFKVYSASAGSGKTFTLVKEYIKVLLSSEDIFTFQKVLAVTFTNKAAGEMKERVLSNLEDFSKGIENDLFRLLIQEIAIDKSTLVLRSKKIVDVILQNYAAFSITTIDSFTHKIIKSFAYDLGLSLNFQVEMDAVSLLNEAVDVLISKIGTDKNLTQLLINYSLEKIDDDKSWDISKDLNDFAKVVLNENDAHHFEELSKNNIEHFTNLKSKLNKQQKQLTATLSKVGEECLVLFEKHGLSQKDFSRGTIPKFFNDVKEKSTDFKFISRAETIQKAIENHQYYTKSTKPEIAQTIENIVPDITAYFINAKVVYRQFLLNNLVLRNLIPLAVLNNINLELEAIKEDNNIRLNAEFNALISENIKGQPAPFIYERIGQRFQHYFIDEMQDTSVLQWQNLIPLIDNALAQENSNLLIVGDGKQAIYRWRGGKAEQFINLGASSKNPFSIAKELKKLETNYRSYSAVIDFNNSFFQHSANFLQNETYKNIFTEGNMQLTTDKEGGFVSLDFLEKETDKTEDTLKYSKKVLEQIHQIKDQFSLGEICILTRKKKDGVAIANYLSANNVQIVSSETLLLKNSKKVSFIIDALKGMQNPKDEEARFAMLYFLHEHLKVTQEKNLFLKEYLSLHNHQLFQALQKFDITFNINRFHQFTFYEKIEEIIRGFHLIDSSDAYVQFFLDVVLEQQRKATDIVSFLDYWEHKKDTLSIVAPEGVNAVQIMTIHKSKGLEFPVVIFPCDVDIYRQIKPKVWLDDLPSDFDNFKSLLVNYTKDLSYVSQKGLTLYNHQREELELDNFNLLYVALTRAVEQLYIITEKKTSVKGEENTNFYSGVFINYLKKELLWKDELLHYSFGKIKRSSPKKADFNLAETHSNFISSSWQDHNIILLASASRLWDTLQGEAINFGNLFHEILSKIITEKDVLSVLDEYHQQNLVNDLQKDALTQKIIKIIHHPKLQKWYSNAVIVFNEREIVDVDNQVIIPDRLCFEEKAVTIIDYKTGAPSAEHAQQLLKYERVLLTMNFTINKKILVYINDNIDVVMV